MAVPFSPKVINEGQAISGAQVNHLPIVAHYARRLGLVEIVNRLVPTQMEVEPGKIVLGMVLDTLSGRSPLYHLESAFQDCDRALFFGEDLPAEYFNDDNVGRVLDYLDQAGLTENTVVIYSSDQGFYLGEHGWYDKRWMFEESFKMPFLMDAGRAARIVKRGLARNKARIAFPFPTYFVAWLVGALAPTLTDPWLKRTPKKPALEEVKAEPRGAE